MPMIILLLPNIAAYVVEQTWSRLVMYQSVDTELGVYRSRRHYCKVLASHVVLSPNSTIATNITDGAPTTTAHGFILC